MSAGGVEDMSPREAYFHSLRLWLQQAHLHQSLSACFPYYLLSLQGAAPGSSAATGFSGSPTALNNNNYQHANGARPADRPLDDNATPTEVISRYGGYEYLIPPLYKRLAAEFIDFIVLFVLKLAITYVAVDYFEFIDLERFDVETIAKNLEDYKLAIEITSEILLLEFLYRILVCFFEAACLTLTFGGRTGGATPGKLLLGIRVVSAVAIVPVENRLRDTVLIYPAKNLTFLNSLCRSLVKNILISLLFPLCFILFVFQYNRTGYDVICNVIVVEENMYPPFRNRA